METNELIDALQKETCYCPRKESLQMLLDAGERIAVRAKEFILTPGLTDSSVYLVMDGMIRLGWYDDNREVTYGFGGVCSFFLSPKGMYANTESHFFIIANTDCVIMRWTNAVFREIISESHDLCQFFFYIAMGQFYSTEMKASIIKGSAETRYDNLINNPEQKKLNVLSKSPNLLQSVSSKVLASYLGVSPSYLSNIRKRSLKKVRAKLQKNGASKIQNGAKNVAELSNLSPSEQIICILEANPALTVEELSKTMRLSVRCVKYHISGLKALGLLRREGNNRTGHWQVKR